MKLIWRGRELEAKMTRAVKTAINETMTRTVVHAKKNHPWINRSSVLEGSIQITSLATRRGNRITGRWGSKGVIYAIFLEIKKEWMWLRPAADKIYPSLAGNIKRNLKLGR